MKKVRPPYIDREIHESFKTMVKNEKGGRIRDTLKEEIEKAYLFYQICGKEMHCLSKDKMIAHLEGIEWKVVVDVDGSRDIDIVEEFKKVFKDVYSLKKKTLQQFIIEMTGKSGDYTYRKYSQILFKSGVISYDSKDKKFFTSNKAMGRIKSKEQKEDSRIKEIKKAKKEADEFFEGLYEV